MRRDCVIALILVAITWTAFFGVWNFAFVNFDDLRFTIENDYVRGGLTLEGIRWAFTPGTTENWHPLTWLSLMLDAELYGRFAERVSQTAGGYHLTNLVLHTLNALLLYWVLARATSSAWKSAFVAALFAIHPLHVESVAWISERKDVLSTLFGLLAMACYVVYAQSRRGERRRRLLYVLSFAAFAGSLLSKQMLVTLPFVLLLMDYWPLRRIGEPDGAAGPQQDAAASWTSLVVEKLPFFALTIAFCAIAYRAQRGGGSFELDIPLSLRIENAVAVYGLYLWKMVWPVRLAIFYPYPKGAIPTVELLGAVAVLVAISVFALVQLRRRRYVMVGWLWYLGTLVPVIGLLQIGHQRMADRYTYFPLVGVFIAATWLTSSLVRGSRGWQTALGLAGALMLGALLFVTRQQTAVWQNSFTLFEHAIAVTDDNYLAHNNLGTALRMRGESEAAFAHFRRAYEIYPNYALTHNNMGTALQARGRHDEALRHFEEAVRLDPQMADAHNNLANMLQRFGRHEEALEHYDRAIQLEPDKASVHHNMGIALQVMGRFDAAIRAFRLAVAIDPGYAHAYANLGNALQAAGRVDEAVVQYRRALQLRPDNANAHCNLAKALGSQGKHEEAVEHYRECLRLSPDDPSAKAGLAEALIHLDQNDEAIAELQSALERQPRHRDLLLLLARAERQAGRLDEAIAGYRRVIELYPRFAAARYEIGLALLEQDSRAEAIEQFQAALEIDPEHDEARDQLRRLGAQPDDRGGASIPD